MKKKKMDYYKCSRCNFVEISSNATTIDDKNIKYYLKCPFTKEEIVLDKCPDELPRMR